MDDNVQKQLIEISIQDEDVKWLGTALSLAE